MHIGDWYDDGDRAAIGEIEKALEDFNDQRTYNPFGWIGWLLVESGSMEITVESADGKFIGRFTQSPVAELHAFMDRLEEGLE